MSHFSRPWYDRHGNDRVCLVTGHTSSLRGVVPQALTLLGGVRFIAWCLRRPFLGECQRGPRHFWECRVRLVYGPARTNLKKALCHTCSFGGAVNKYRWHQILARIVWFFCTMELLIRPRQGCKYYLLYAAVWKYRRNNSQNCHGNSFCSGWKIPFVDDITTLVVGDHGTLIPANHTVSI